MVKKRKIIAVTVLLIIFLGIFFQFQNDVGDRQKNIVQDTEQETVQDIEDDSIRDFVEESVRKQEELCSFAEGTWIFADFYPLLTGLSSRDSAEDYLNKKISFSLSDEKELFLEFNNKKYQLVRVRPLANHYLMDSGYSAYIERQVLDGYTCVLLFENDEEQLEIYINENEKMFLQIIDDVADYAYFMLEKITGDKKEEMNLAYFQNKAEYLIDECKLHHRYSNLEIDIKRLGAKESETEFLCDKDITVDIKNQTVILQFDEETLQLENVEEVMGLSVSFMFDSTTICLGGQSALLYTFVNEKYRIQIMERSDGKSFIKVIYGESDEADIYLCDSE
ncbi:MAG: hypothetical protein ACI4S2_12705 [Lachnospiraceae bacterium]